jgi:hypothetical protein
MSTDFEQRLRAEMQQVPVRPRPGLVKEAYRGYRGKRRMTRAVVAAGAAVAIAAGTAAGLTAATTTPGTILKQTTAYVLRHVVSALATTNQITYTNTITSFVQPEDGEVTRNVTDIWAYGTMDRQLEESASGQPIYDTWVQTYHGKPTNIWVNYQQRSFERFGIAPAGPAGTAPKLSVCGKPGVILIAQGATAADWKLVIESGLRCGLFHVAGHQQVDGIDAIKVTGSADSGISFLGVNASDITLWVDPDTYLPVQIAGTQSASSVDPNLVTTLIHFRWLPPTRANLAQLIGTIPPGFHLTHPL